MFWASISKLSYRTNGGATTKLNAPVDCYIIYINCYTAFRAPSVLSLYLPPLGFSFLTTEKASISSGFGLFRDGCRIGAATADISLRRLMIFTSVALHIRLSSIAGYTVEHFRFRDEINLPLCAPTVVLGTFSCVQPLRTVELLVSAVFIDCTNGHLLLTMEPNERMPFADSVCFDVAGTTALTHNRDLNA